MDNSKQFLVEIGENYFTCTQNCPSLTLYKTTYRKQLAVTCTGMKISVLVSVLTLTALSLERWLAICQPLMFRHTSVRAKRALAIVWFVSLVAAVPDAISLDIHEASDNSTLEGNNNVTLDHVSCAPSWTELSETIQLWVMFVIFYLVPLAIMTFTYIKVALCLWRSGFSNDNDEASANVPRAQVLLRRKKAKMLIVVVALFAVCYLPVYVLFLLRPCSIAVLAKGRHDECRLNQHPSRLGFYHTDHTAEHKGYKKKKALSELTAWQVKPHLLFYLLDSGCPHGPACPLWRPCLSHDVACVE
ncbi:Orexin receptor type 2 [Bulinus truncatus]|nr:Orexin receptor type 2 [Bulinus truncatus]